MTTTYCWKKKCRTFMFVGACRCSLTDDTSDVLFLLYVFSSGCCPGYARSGWLGTEVVTHGTLILHLIRGSEPKGCHTEFVRC